MEEISFSGLVVVAAIALLAPLVLGLVPRLRLPAVVLEIVAGIVVGPAVLDWVPIDTVIRVFALFGLAFLLFLAGFVVAGGVAVVGLLRLERSMGLSSVLLRLQDTAARIRVRAAPAVLYRSLVGNRRTVVAGLLQATSLPFIVAASMIGVELGVISPATSAALIGAGLLSVLLFPLIAATILGRGGRPETASGAGPAAVGALGR